VRYCHNICLQGLSKLTPNSIWDSWFAHWISNPRSLMTNRVTNIQNSKHSIILDEWSLETRHSSFMYGRFQVWLPVQKQVILAYVHCSSSKMQFHEANSELLLLNLSQLFLPHPPQFTFHRFQQHTIYESQHKLRN
jgi:hypothetical protein